MASTKTFLSKLSAYFLVALAGQMAAASTLSSQPGVLLTLGPSSTHHTGLSTLYNPAVGELVVSKEDSVRWGYISSFGVTAEVGDFDNFDTEVEDLIDDLDEDNLDINDAEDIIARYEAIRPKLREEGYVKANAHLMFPGAPLSIRSETLGGVITINARGVADLNASFLDDTISFEDPDSDGQGELETNTSVYVKGAETAHIGLGYSTKLSDISFIGDAMENVGGGLYGGVSLNFYQIKLSKQVIALNEVDDDEDLSDIIDDNYEENQEESSNVGIDLGLVWQTDYLQLGLAWRNINEPEFDYGEIGGVCAADDVNCETANFFAGRINLNETYTMDSQFAADVSLLSPNAMWSLSAAYDFNEVYDPVGDEFQWFTVGGGFHSDWFGARLGYSKNTVGSEVDALNLGFSIGAFTLDARYGLDSVAYDGDDIPRTVGLNIGLESRF